MKKVIICTVIITMILSLFSCKVKPQNTDEEIAGAITEQAKENLDSEQKEVDNVQQEKDDAVKIDGTEREDTVQVPVKKVTLTDATEKYLDIIKNRKNTEDTKEQLPANKDFDINGKKVTLALKEKTHIVKLSAYRYDYVDSEGIIYYFHENDGFIGINNPNNPSKKYSDAITEQEALEIAKTYASKLFPEEFDKYTLWTTNKFDSFSVPSYSFAFSKRYGADDSLHGEICIVEVYENGTVKSCDIDGLYSFKEFDPLLVANVTKQEVDKVLMDSLSKQYDNIDEYDVTIEGYELLQYEKDKWVITLSVTIENEDVTIYADNFFIEIN